MLSIAWKFDSKMYRRQLLLMNIILGIVYAMFKDSLLLLVAK